MSYRRFQQRRHYGNATLWDVCDSVISLLFIRLRRYGLVARIASKCIRIKNIADKIIIRRGCSISAVVVAGTHHNIPIDMHNKIDRLESVRLIFRFAFSFSLYFPSPRICGDDIRSKSNAWLLLTEAEAHRIFVGCVCRRRRIHFIDLQ